MLTFFKDLKKINENTSTQKCEKGVDEEKLRQYLKDVVTEAVSGKSVIGLTLELYLSECQERGKPLDFNLLEIFGDVTINELLGEKFVKDDTLNSSVDSIKIKDARNRIETLEKLISKGVVKYLDFVELIGPMKISLLHKTIVIMESEKKED
ncbi:MAG: hypothetical protein ACOCQD_05520 [archaeon]